MSQINASKDSDGFEPPGTSDQSGKSPLFSISEISENAQVDKEKTIIRCRSNPLLPKSNNGRKFETRSRRTFFPAYFCLSPLLKHVKTVVGGFGKKVVLVLG